jgi:DNA polymerase III subunit gamma/tau
VADPPPVERQAAREAIRPTREGGEPPPIAPDLAEADASASRDDLDAEVDDTSGADLLARELGAEVIQEIPHQ